MKIFFQLVALSLMLLGAADKATASDPAEFVAAYRAAYQAGNVEKLVHWEGIPESEQERFRVALKAALGHELNKVEVVEVPPDTKLEFQVGGVTRVYNLKPVKKLVVSFKKGPEFGMPGTSYLLGEFKDSYFIAVLVPKAAS